MSRDWTPAEYHEADKIYDFRNKTFYITDVDGNKTPCMSEKERFLAEEYPNFGFLYSKAEEFWNALGDDRKEIFAGIEKHLKKIITENKSDGSPLGEWYFGRLDKNYYYGEHNDNLLFDALIKEGE